jgi:hypothetical protein
LHKKGEGGQLDQGVLSDTYADFENSKEDNKRESILINTIISNVSPKPKVPPML